MLSDNQQLNEILNEVEANLKRAIRICLEDLKKNPEKEGEYFDLWVQYATKVGRFFKVEAQRTGNLQLPRKIKKRLLKRFIF